MNKVAVLFGGASAEREVSLMSGAAVLKALQAQGVNAHAFDPATRNIGELKQAQFTAAFIALHGRYGEDGTVQGALELLGIPYTGSGVMASSIAIDKRMTKRIWEAAGLATPAWCLASRPLDVLAAFAQFKASGHNMIVKPSLEGSSLGLTRVTDTAQCEAAFYAASSIDGQALCEAWIEGDEVTGAVLQICSEQNAARPEQNASRPEQNASRPELVEGQHFDKHHANEIRALPLIRIAAPNGDYDFQHKYYTDDVTYHVPSGLPIAEEEAIQSLVLKAFQTLDCRGWARADVMIDAKTRTPYLLEINTSPGMTSHSLVPMAAKAAGISFESLCLRILQSARLDHEKAAHA
ncbi:MAG: D-alanine--D-alanine ligase [Cytophagales bacterium]|nr:D-alanine--D-alanine ligase [Cytophagales bacterium]